MKIAIIRRKFTAFGGAENFILRASSGLSQLGINFFIISELWKQNANNSKNIHWIEAKSNGLFRFSKLLSFQKSVMKIIALNNFDLIQSHERLTGVDIYRLGDGIHAAWIDRMKKISPWYKKAWLSIDPYHQKIIFPTPDNIPIQYIGDKNSFLTIQHYTNGLMDKILQEKYLLATRANTKKYAGVSEL